MATEVLIERNLAGLEDLLIGTGTVVQRRANKNVTVTKLNSKNFPFDEKRTLEDVLKEDRGQKFAVFNIDSKGYLIATYAETGIFSINSNGELVLEYKENA